MDNSPRFLRISIMLLFIFSFASQVWAADAGNKTCAYFFYGDGCPHCAKVEPFINGIEAKYPNLEVHRFEIYNNRPNMVLFNKFAYSYGIPESETGVPTIFIGNTYLAGDGPIAEKLEHEIESNIGAGCPDLEKIVNPLEETGATSPTKPLGELSLVTVIGAALVDSINPCAFAVLLILLGTLLSTGERGKALRSGLAFTVSIYIVYFLFGLGLFSALQVSGLSYWFYKIIGVVAILLGVLNIKDFLWYGSGGFVMEIPRSWRPTLKKLLGTVTSPAGAFLMGFVVCLFELPCTGGPYIFILGLLAERSTMLAAIPILLLYNLFLVVPLLVITLLMYSGFRKVEEMNEWKEKNLRELHLIAGLINGCAGAHDSFQYGLIGDLR
ncbi:MAG: cytochrome c biogenesis protein CcdA [Candidatus Micrarchaeia archaeon]